MFLSVAACVSMHAQVVSAITVDRTVVPNGGELVTVFQKSGTVQVPVVSYLKDTLGDDDPANDRLRQVWVLNHKRQSLPRHILAAVPFLYTRLPSSPPKPGKVPRPVLDMAKPHDSTMNGILQQVVQVMALDPLGTPYRAATRSYRLNRSQHRQLRIAEAASALESAGSDYPEVRDVRSRLVLSSRLLGGLVSDKNLDLIHEKEVMRTEEMRGRNWELLRQQAERNNLVFQPLQIAGGPPSHALLWISKQDLLNASSETEFHGRFLSISNPWKDSSLRNPEKLRKRYTDGDLVPLALYSLEHPKVPYLLADMRDSLAPKRREMFRRATQDATVGILGVSRFANLEYFAASWIWDFLSNRRGAANNRAWRIRSYAELRQKLNLDTTLDPQLREELKRRTAQLSINPLEDRLAIDAEIARVQYESLRHYAEDPRGLALVLERNRQEEAARYFRGTKRRALMATAHRLSFGLYKGRVTTDSVMLAALDRRRRIQTHTRYLARVLEAGPSTDVAMDLAPVRHAVRELYKLDSSDPVIRDLVIRVARQANDSVINDTNNLILSTEAPVQQQ